MIRSQRSTSFFTSLPQTAELNSYNRGHRRGKQNPFKPAHETARFTIRLPDSGSDSRPGEARRRERRHSRGPRSDGSASRYGGRLPCRRYSRLAAEREETGRLQSEPSIPTPNCGQTSSDSLSSGLPVAGAQTRHLSHSGIGPKLETENEIQREGNSSKGRNFGPQISGAPLDPVSERGASS